MSDLETRVRDMLHERAQDVRTLPDRLHRLHPPARDNAAHRSRVWLVAASIIVVLAVVGGALAIGRSSSKHSAPGGTRTPTPPTSSPTAAPVTLILDPFRVSLTLPSGYRALTWVSLPAYRQVTLAGKNGGTTPTVFVTVWSDGRFDGYDPAWQQTKFQGRTAYLGVAQRPGTTTRYRSLVFTSTRGNVVIVQGATAATSSETALRGFARLVRPDAARPGDAGLAPYPVPFRFTTMYPGLALASVDDRRGAGSDLVVGLVGDARVTVIVRTQRGFGGLGLGSTAQPRTIAGRTAVFDAAGGAAAVQISDTQVVVVRALTRGAGNVPAPAVVERIVTGLKAQNTTLLEALP